MAASSSSSSSAVESISAKLLARAPTDVPLTPKSPWDTSLRAEIQSVKPSRGGSSRGSSDVLKAAMHLCNDDIDNAHELAQAHEESMTANLIHAILHRREQDYWNSKWWLSRIKHPLLAQIHNGTSGAKNFVDQVERVETSSSSNNTLSEKEELQEKQWEELRCLLEYALKEAGL
ncbi:hypothetical protein P389DRAFT_193711 [Cystobasidium minutum MCA 4210]|uniref:uncharacterized protein n=1 Tax=Cystobasidium minutum MCA 4210 TaxID=1397322 RepID=UPI0034CFB758|eukprot:jgi/Rhomi1/193711/gm1.1925_g